MKLYNLETSKIKRVKPGDVTIAIYGMGKMGLPLGVVFANHGFKVIGVGKSRDNTEKLNRGVNTVVGEKDLSESLKKAVKSHNFSATHNGVDAAKKSDIQIIIIPTFLTKNNEPDLSIVNDVTTKIAQGLEKGDIVILESTAPPGTTVNYIGGLLEKKTGLKLNKDFGIAHCPERTNSGTAISDILGRINPKIVGGSDRKTTEIIKWLYETINKRGVVVVKNPTEAEMVKVSEGMYRDTNIAYANNLYLICQELGIDARSVIKAANTDAACHILTPGPGVGGHCIPVYPYFILKNVKANKELIRLARKINDDMSHYVISLAKGLLKKNSVDFKGANVLLLGIAYRGGVKETRKSPALKIADELHGKVKNIFAYDPMFNEDETKKYGLTYKKNFDQIDCIIVAANHKEFQTLNWKNIAKKMRTKTMVDTVNLLDSNLLTKLGFMFEKI